MEKQQEKQREKQHGLRICLNCGRAHIHPGTPEEEYRQEELCRNQDYVDMLMEQAMLYENWL